MENVYRTGIFHHSKFHLIWVYFECIDTLIRKDRKCVDDVKTIMIRYHIWMYFYVLQKFILIDRLD